MICLLAPTHAQLPNRRGAYKVGAVVFTDEMTDNLGDKVDEIRGLPRSKEDLAVTRALSSAFQGVSRETWLRRFVQMDIYKVSKACGIEAQDYCHQEYVSMPRYMVHSPCPSFPAPFAGPSVHLNMDAVIAPGCTGIQRLRWAHRRGDAKEWLGHGHINNSMGLKGHLWPALHALRPLRVVSQWPWRTGIQKQIGRCSQQTASLDGGNMFRLLD